MTDHKDLDDKYWCSIALGRLLGYYKDLADEYWRPLRVGGAPLVIEKI